MAWLLSIGIFTLKQRYNHYCIMPKKQTKSKIQQHSHSHSPPRNHNIGRPQDHELETYFMQKLRAGKLQAISAESEAEIICHQFQDSDAEGKTQQGFAQEKVKMVVNWFESIDPDRFKLLWQGFIGSSEKWEFKEVTSILDFPEYLFCDECDLCYVLHSLLSPSRSQFSNDQLLFLQLLCFASRDQISFRVLKSLQMNLPTMLAIMSHVKTSVQQLSRELGFEEEKPKFEPKNEISPQLRKGEVSQLLSKVEASEGMPQKAKKIQKKQKEKEKRRGRPRKPGNGMREDQQLKTEQLQQVAQKLITHIIRSYAYVYPTEIRLKQKQNIRNVVSTSEKGIGCRPDDDL